MSPSYALIIELSENEKLQKYRIVLSQHNGFLHKWLVHLNFDMFTAAMIFFSERFLNMCKPRTTFYLFDGLARLDLYFMEVRWLAYRARWGWWIQASSVPCNRKFSRKWNLLFFKAVPPNRLPFYLGRPHHDICILNSHEFLKFTSFNIWR